MVAHREQQLGERVALEQRAHSRLGVVGRNADIGSSNSRSDRGRAGAHATGRDLFIEVGAVTPKATTQIELAVATIAHRVAPVAPHLGPPAPVDIVNGTIALLAFAGADLVAWLCPPTAAAPPMP